MNIEDYNEEIRKKVMQYTGALADAIQADLVVVCVLRFEGGEWKPNGCVGGSDEGMARKAEGVKEAAEFIGKELLNEVISCSSMAH